MKQMLQIYCKNNNISKEFPIGSSLLDIYYGFNLNFPYQVVSAKVNNRSEGLNFRVYNNKDVEFLYVCAFSLLCALQSCQRTLSEWQTFCGAPGIQRILLQFADRAPRHT